MKSGLTLTKFKFIVSVFLKLEVLYSSGVLKICNEVPKWLLGNHLLFLSVCIVETSNCKCNTICKMCSDANLKVSLSRSENSPSGGMIGPGNTPVLHAILSRIFPQLNFHACFHDAYGYLYRNEKRGPGYMYAAPFVCAPECCLVGHITGLFYLLYLRVKSRHIFRELGSRSRT